MTVLNTVGMDGGGGFFQVCLGLLEGPPNPSKSSPPKKVSGLFKDHGANDKGPAGKVQDHPEQAKVR